MYRKRTTEGTGPVRLLSPEAINVFCQNTLGGILPSTWVYNIALFLGSVVLFFIFLLLILVRNASQLSTPEINQRVIYKGVPQKIAYVNFSGEIAYQTDDSL